MPIDVDGMRFEFDHGWTAGKYDEWSYYRRYTRFRQGIKAVDLVATDPDRTAWLIEVKDYRQNRRTKVIDLADEVAQKVHDTLAALAAAQTNANDNEERAMARSLVRARKARVVLHLEQPAKHSKLFPRAIDPTKVQQKLRTLVKPIDAHALVVESSNMRGLSWAVT